MPTSRPRRFFQMPAIDQPDPEPGFQHSSDEFVIPAVDEEGNSVRCQYRCPGELLGWAADIVHSKKFPFQREGDLMRYGLYLACLQLSRIEKDVPSLQGKIDSMNELVRRRVAAASITNHLDHLGEAINEFVKKKAWGEITYILAAEKRNAEQSLQCEPYWAERWLQGLKERFSDIEALAVSKLDTIQLLPKRTPEERG